MRLKEITGKANSECTSAYMHSKRTWYTLTYHHFPIKFNIFRSGYGGHGCKREG